jgi:hypothetical protein
MYGLSEDCVRSPKDRVRIPKDCVRIPKDLSGVWEEFLLPN